MRKYLSILFRWNLMLMAVIQIWALFLQQMTAVIAMIGGIRSCIYIIQYEETNHIRRIGWAVFIFLMIRTAGVLYAQDIERAVEDMQFPLLGLIFFSFTDWQNQRKNCCTIFTLNFKFSVIFFRKIFNHA